MLICSFDSCERPIVTVKSGLCSGHYSQQRAGLTLRPIKIIARHTNPCARDDLGRKRCLKCTNWKPESEFCKNVHGSDNLNYLCKSCTRAQKYLGRYGVTPDQVQAIHTAQNGCCRICGVHEHDSPNQCLYVDHDHTHCSQRQGCPECVRGLLCVKCNSLIGFAGDSAELLLAAVSYLRESTPGKVPNPV